MHRIVVLALVLPACAHRLDVRPEAPAAPAPVAATDPVRDPQLTAPDRTIRFEPVEIVSSPQQVAISELNDEELFAIGKAALEAGDNAKAVLHFERLADFFPESPRRGDALQYAGLMLERMKDYAGALSRFVEAAKVRGETEAGAESLFKAADAYFFLGDVDAATGILERLETATFVTAVRQAEAEVKRGICLFTAGRYDDSERVLRAIISRVQKDMREEVRDGYLPSQAQFYLAEIYRAHFLEVVLDPTTRTRDELMQDLEYKAQMLLSAQGHYLRCIRVGHPEWATASGFRIGELYQKLHEQMVDSKAPTDLTAEEAQVYREELRSKIRVLVTKAIDAYEKTLATAERVGARNPFVAETRAQLDRMKQLLLSDEATAKTNEAPAPARTDPS